MLKQYASIGENAEMIFITISSEIHAKWLLNSFFWDCTNGLQVSMKLWIHVYDNIIKKTD